MTVRIHPQSVCSGIPWTACVLSICLVAMSFAREKSANVLRPSDDSRSPPLFLDLFQQHKEPRVLATDIRFSSAIGPVSGYLARPDTTERLPAILLISAEEGLNDWMKENARDLCGIGYVVLAVASKSDSTRDSNKSSGPVDDPGFERTLAKLSAAVRWLRRRPDALPGQVGVVGWSKGGDLALALSGAAPLQACVLCDASLTADRAVIGGLRGTPVLVISAGRNAIARKVLPHLQRALDDAQIFHRVRIFEGVSPGFMNSGREGLALDAANKAYVEIYEFLGKYVEDSLQNSVFSVPHAHSGPSDEPVATIADIMRAVNDGGGVRGDLMKALEREPSNAQQWRRVRADAAILAEAGKLLEKLTPPRGPGRRWLEQCRSYAAVGAATVVAADRRDYSGAIRSMQTLKAQCTSCHEQHR
jgi:dienelactone hydrolase